MSMVMSKPPSIAKLRKLIQAQIKHEQTFIERMKGEENPQIKKSVTEAQGRLEAFEAVYWASRGDYAFITIGVEK